MSETTFLPEQPNFILVDGSYYIFYRYYAIFNWFKLAKKDETLENPIENESLLKKNLNQLLSIS